MFGGKIYENSNQWAGFSLVDGPSGPLHSLSEHVCTSLLQSKHLDTFCTVIHSIQVFGSLQARSSDWGTVNGTQTGISKHPF